MIPSSAPTVPAAAAPIDLSDEEILKFKVADLKIELAKRGLRGTGGKATLQQRLKEGLHLVVGAPGGEKRDSSMSGLPFLAW